MPTNLPENIGQDTHRVQPGIVEEFARIISHLSADKDCRAITSLVLEMDSLRARNKELESAMEESKVAETRNFAKIQSVMNDKQEVDQRCRQKDAEVEKAQRQACEAKEKLRLALEEGAALKRELKSTNEGVEKAMASGKKQDLLIASLNGTITKLQESAKQAEKNLTNAHEVERAQAKTRYDVVSQNLEALKKRTFPLQTTSNLALNGHRGQLKGLFDDACRLVYHFFGHLQLESLEVVEGKWEKLTEDHALTHIPMPRSNSELATQMRVAAVLRLISVMACDYIFQPVYLTPDGMEVAEIIYQLGSLEAEWMRSVLLNIERKQQAGYGMERAKIAAGKIIELVGFLMNSTADTQKLKDALCQWCEKAAKLWMSLQQLRPTIEAQLEVQVDGQGFLGWKSFPEQSLRDKHPVTGAQDGTTSKPDNKAQLVMEDLAAGLWPRFLATTGDEHSDVLMHGYALLNAQRVAASQEVKALAASLDRGGGSHRTAHGRKRQVQVRGIIGGVNGSTDKISFLS